MLFRDLPGVTTCRFKQGEYLLRRGEPMPYVYYLKKGRGKARGFDAVWLGDDQHDQGWWSDHGIDRGVAGDLRFAFQWLLQR